MKAFITFLCIAFLGVALPAFAEEVGIIDTDGLKAMLGSENLVVIDVRAGRDWSSSEFKIKGAVREEPGNTASWAGKYPKDKTYVLYCA
jgi:rhodanese-related sulfurtransferase